MLYIHGLSVSMAEGMAEYLHRHIRRELGLSAEQGKRYSWGYPACPDTDQHHTLFRLLPRGRTRHGGLGGGRSSPSSLRRRW